MYCKLISLRHQVTIVAHFKLQTLPDLRNFRLNAVSKIELRKTVIMTFFNAHDETKVGEEYCWAVTQAVGRSCSGKSGSSALEFRFQQDTLVYTYTAGHMHTQFQLAPDPTEPRGVSVI
jgi:hypothetical protein